MKKHTEMEEYDGFLFLPSEDEDEETSAMEFRFIKYKQDFGPAVEGNDIGEKYHVAFFKRDADGQFQFDEEFEAIFADPMTYAKGFIGHNLFGTMVKKKERTKEWFDEYLTDIKKSVILANQKS
jgi:hypothetical protein